MNDEQKDDLLNDSSALNFLGTMKRYPFNGRSKYLMDKFFIIGYDYSTLNKILIKKDLDFIVNSSKNSEEEQSDKNKNKKLPQEFCIDEPPSLINEISNDYSKEVLDIDIIIEMIFPNKPNFYYVEEEINPVPQYFSCEKIVKLTEINDDIRRTKTNNKEFEISNFINSGKNKVNNGLNFSPFSGNKYNENKKTSKEEYIPRSYNIIFSSNPQSGANSKKSINGFAHIFYKKFVENKVKNNTIYSFYVPIVFCIISEFPYYNSYYRLTRQIMLLFKKKIIEVPIEFTIQNILNYTLSPINDEVILNITPISLIKLWDSGSANINSIEEVEEDKEKENKKNKEVKPFSIEDPIQEEKAEEKVATPIIFNTKKKDIRKSKFKQMKSGDYDKAKSPIIYKSTRTKNTGKPQNSLRFSYKDKKGLKNQMEFLNKFSSNPGPTPLSFIPKFTKTEEESTIKFEPIKFPFLPGYPLIQYNLAKVLLNTLSSYDVILIFIYTFLEKDVIFFSSNLELLSLTMNSYQNLNFPLNDEKYYFINACVSYDNYIKGNSTFVGSAFTTMVGINSQYQPKYLSSCTHKLKDHLAIDLDNGSIHQEKDPTNKDTTSKNKSPFDFIKRICKGKELKEEKESKTILFREIKALNDELNECKDKILNDECRDYKYIDYNKNINSINRQIQESFYRFINNICIYIYQNLIISISTNGLKKSETVKTELQFDTSSFNDNYIKEEILFLNELKDTMKFESFFYGFIQSYNPIDLYKIPLTFTEEFVSILSRKSNMQLKNIKFFSLFDHLYNKNQHGRNDIDFLPFMSKYFTQYKEKFDRDIQDYYIEQKESKNKFNLFDFINDKKVFNFNYIWYELDNNLIIKYLDLLKNLKPEEYQNLFHFQLLNLEQNNIKNVLVSDIENAVEKYAIDTNFLNKSDICCGNILLLFTITLKSFRSCVDTQSFLSTLFHDFTIFRKYYTIVMNMVYKLMEECIKKKDYSHAQNFLLCYYPCINSMNDKKLVPNENLMNTINKFNLIDIEILSKKADKNKEEGLYETPVSEQKKSKVKKELNTNNLYVCYNFTKNGTITEETIINEINNYPINYESKFKNSIFPKVKFRMGKRIIECEIFSQLKILDMLTKEYNLFNKDLDTKKINSKILLEATMNIFLFIRNDNELKIKSEVIEILNIIFYIYFEKYSEDIKKEKSEKEEREEIEEKEKE
jgi:hypothetical protein